MGVLILNTAQLYFVVILFKKYESSIEVKNYSFYSKSYSSNVRDWLWLTRFKITGFVHLSENISACISFDPEDWESWIKEMESQLQN
ncbi:hypothetical protein GCM10026987_09080 [Belliella aquatica]|uniref:Uncharacterized protein n=1 Tax=Belliella aquatica TaxID=1323734 RepID=A0ABQ1M988_9BACT|nr:hypothetical protein GCM10010993_12840 [Belliella aquatica]